MLDSAVIELSNMQLDKAKEILGFIPAYIELGDYNGAISRAYYAAFHSLKALEVLEGYDSKKHSGVISHFRQEYIKTGKINAELSKIIGRLQEARGASDYDVAMRFQLIDAQEAFENAKTFVGEIEKYINEQLAKASE